MKSRYKWKLDSSCGCCWLVSEGKGADETIIMSVSEHEDGTFNAHVYSPESEGHKTIAAAKKWAEAAIKRLGGVK